ncbi:hypothetical protein ACWWU7_02350 [Stenotrophomonas sp. SM006]
MHLLLATLIAALPAFGTSSSAAGRAGDMPGPEAVPQHYSIEECHSYAEAAAALVEERNHRGDKGSMQNLLVGPEEARRDMLALIDYVWSEYGVLAWSQPHQAKTVLESQCEGRKSSADIGARID